MLRNSIRTEVVMPSSSPEAVWRTFSDWPQWKEWSSLEVLEEPKAVGAKFKVKFSQGSSSQVLNPELLQLDVNTELRWRGKLWGSDWLFVAEHYFRFEPTPDSKGTRLVHGEEFSGLMVPLLSGMVKQAKGEFERFNEQLRARVEQGSGK